MLFRRLHACFGVRLASRVAAAWILVFATQATAVAEQPLRVGVAANFRGVAEELAALYEKRFAQTVQISSASTGVLAAQLMAGAPFDVLLAADSKRPRRLVKEGLAAGDARCYARGSLVLLGAPSLELAIAGSGRIAIANPRLAPYGSAALEVLESTAGGGLRPSRLVLGSNVLQAYQFFRSGAAATALVARSLSPSEGLALPFEAHAPIEQHLIVSAGSSQPDAAQRFVGFLLSADAEPLLAHYGYRRCS